MPNDIDTVVRELQEARASYDATTDLWNRHGNCQNWANMQAAGRVWNELCSRHMPAILEALERVTGERDAAKTTAALMLQEREDYAKRLRDIQEILDRKGPIDV